MNPEANSVGNEMWHEHPIALVGQGLLSVVVLGLSLIGVFYLSPWCVFGVIIAPAWLWLCNWHRKQRSYSITREGRIYIRNFLGLHVKTFSLFVARANYSQDLLGRWLDYGDIVLDVPGESMRLRRVERFRTLRQRIEQGLRLSNQPVPVLPNIYIIAPPHQPSAEVPVPGDRSRDIQVVNETFGQHRY